MKKYIIIASVALGASCLISCSDFLDVQTQGYPTQDQYFKNDQQAVDAVDAIYRKLIEGDGIIGREIYWEQACANTIVWGRSRNSMLPVANFSPTGDEDKLRDIFNSCYSSGMNRANWVINSLLEKQKDTELTAVESRSLGEAYFLRAYYHFLIAYRYGTKDLGVPYVAYEDVEGGYNYEIPEQQATVMVNYDYITKDLKKAEGLLSTLEEYPAADKGRATKAAAAALMAKAYAYWATWDKSQWANVIECVDRLEKDYGRDLVPDFKTLFSPEVSDFWNVEYCFGWPSTGGFDNGGSGGGVEFPGVSFENGGWGKFNGWGQFKPSYDIYEEMAKDNVDGAKNYRLENSILEYNQEFMYFGEPFAFYSARDFEAGFAIGKYLQALAPADPVGAGYLCSNGDFPVFQLNYPIVRFADCLLLRAEAYLATGVADKATADINRVRSRSGLKTIGTATWADLYHERVCELAFEMAADHAYDCKRWAYSGNESTAGTEIQTLALNELNSRPKVRWYYNYPVITNTEERTNGTTGETKIFRLSDDVLDTSAEPVRSRTPITLYKADDEAHFWDKDYAPAVLSTAWPWAEVNDYEDAITKGAGWTDKNISFPYPSEQINKSGGKLKNPPSWN